MRIIDHISDLHFRRVDLRAADALLTARHTDAGVPGYRAAFWDRPHVFDGPMQDEAFDFLVGELGTAPSAR